MKSQRVKQILQRYKEFRNIITIIGLNKLFLKKIA